MATLAELAVRFKADTAAFKQELEATRRHVGNVDRQMQALARGAKNLVGGFLGFQLVQQVFGDTVAAITESERATAKLNAVLRATGGAAGRTAADINQMAEDLAQVSLFGDDEIVNAAAQLATFRNVYGQTFDKALELSADLATVLDTDLKSAVIQVGKALNDPVLGVTALNRSGVTFSETQREMIRNFVQTNDLAAAQKIILEELTHQVGGTASSSGTGLVGAMHRASEAYDNFLETFGQDIPGMGGRSLLEAFFEGLARTIKDITPETDKTKRAIAEFMELGQQYTRLADLIRESDEKLARGESDAGVFRNMGGRKKVESEMAALKARMEALNAEINAASAAATEAERKQNDQAGAARADAARKAAAAAAAEAHQKWLDSLDREGAKLRTLMGDWEKLRNIRMPQITVPPVVDLRADGRERLRALGVPVPPTPEEMKKMSIEARQAWLAPWLNLDFLDAERPGLADEMRTWHALIVNYQGRAVQSATEQSRAFGEAWRSAIEGSQQVFADFFDRIFEQGYDLKAFLLDLARTVKRSFAEMLGAQVVGAFMPGGSSAIPAAPAIPAGVPGISGVSVGGSVQAAPVIVHSSHTYNINTLDSAGVEDVLRRHQGVMAQSVLDAAKRSSNYRRALVQG